MTPEDVRARVAHISCTAGDWEAAHGAEDQLYKDVLNAIAAGAPNARALAQEAVVAALIDFPRYTA